MAERLMSVAAFARHRRTTPRQARRWIKAGLPVTPTTPPKVRVAAADRWLAARRADQGRVAGEIRQALADRTEDAAAELAARLRLHVPAAVVDRLWAERCGRTAELLRAWPALAAPRIAARLRGEDVSLIEDPRLTQPSRDLLVRAPRSSIAVALATQELARQHLEQHAADFDVTDPEVRRLDAKERATWLASPGFTSQRACLDVWRARVTRFARACRHGEWERVAVATDRLAATIAEARGRFLDAAPGAVMRLPAGTGEPAIRRALSEAVENAIDVLRRSGERKSAVNNPKRRGATT